MDKCVLVIDSGIGGVTTLARIRKLMPNLNVIYFADDLFMPYGNKAASEISQRICQIIESFSDKICAVVLACNTATGVAVGLARKLFCVPIVGIEPAILPSLKSDGAVAAIVTPLEARQDKYLKLVENKSVLTLPQANLAFEIEKCLMSGGRIEDIAKDESILKIVETIFVALERSNTRKIVLGCTHYVYLKYTGLLNGYLLFDGNDGVAARLYSFVKDVGQGKTEILFSSQDTKKSQIALELLNDLLLFDF